MSKQENRILFKFLAAQYFRTPLGIYNLNKQLVSKSPKLIYEASKDIQNINISELKEKNYKDKKTFPLKIKPFKNKDKIYLYLETFIGKSAPLLVMQNILEYIYEILIKHNWKILNPPKNKFWITSDNPALFINFNSILDFNYNGGWNSINTNIIFPVSPNKLLFTQVGKPIINIPNPCSRKLYNILTLLICHGSYKEIYSSNDLIDISMYRNRVIDKKAFERENKYWNNTHKLLNIEKDYFKNKY